MGARTTGSWPAAPGARDRAAVERAVEDLERVLAGTLASLAGQGGTRRAAGWLRLEPGGARLVKARGESWASATSAAYERLVGLEGPSDLGEAGLAAELREAARALDVSAGVCLRAGSREAVGLLLLGGPDDPPGRVRPRTLAALGRAAQRLEGPLGAALAALRLGRLDAGIRRLDRLAGLGELVAEIVHEVRNPLVSVKTFLQLLPERLHDEEFRENFFAVVGEELQRIERLLDVVLEQASPRGARAGGDGEASVGECIESVARLLAHRAAAARVELATRVEPELPRVRLGADALRQVLLNLSVNALDATPSGGSVELAAGRVGHAVEIRVADSGPGVSPAVRERLFEPFYSTKDERPGGLGLAISRRIVEEAGGTIAVRDRRGGGAVFRLRLPTG